MQIAIIQPQLSRETHAQNLAAVRAAAKQADADMLILPELFYREHEFDDYLSYLTALARDTQACIVGGSLHTQANGQVYNIGAVVAPDGELLARYSKRHPYGDEHQAGVAPGEGPVRFRWRDVSCAVLICADVWDARLCTPLAPVDLWCVVAESVSEEHATRSARQLWEHLAIARAYEFAGAFALSDWAESSQPDGVATCGAAGFVDPSAKVVCFAPVEQSSQTFTLDVEELAAHRIRRQARNFNHHA